MSVEITEIYPRVFRADAKQTVYVKTNGFSGGLFAKLQPMEKHAVTHSPEYRLESGDIRYPFLPMTDLGGGLYSFEGYFEGEQRFSFKVKSGEEDEPYRAFLYSLEPDLARLRAFKCETHCHSCRSDGSGTPFEVACAYRAAGYDAMALTDHGWMEPSIEALDEVAALTKEFYLMPGEEVHNEWSFYHIVHFGGSYSVNNLLREKKEYIEGQIDKLLAERDFSDVSDARETAFRAVIAQEIRKAGGVAVMAHPYWDVQGEYFMPPEEYVHHWKHGDFDVLELFAGNDNVGNGNNLSEILRGELIAQGYRIPVLGASDAHVTKRHCGYDYFDLQFSIVFAKDAEDIPEAFRDERAVAIERRPEDGRFRGAGKYRLVKYARFLVTEWYEPFAKLCAVHSAAMAEHDKAKIAAAEADIAAFRKRFFAL